MSPTIAMSPPGLSSPFDAGFPCLLRNPCTSGVELSIAIAPPGLSPPCDTGVLNHEHMDFLTSASGKSKCFAEGARTTPALQNSVLKMVPYLSQERQSQALILKEAAVSTANEAAALDTVVEEAANVGYHQHPAFQAAVEMKRAQLHQAHQRNIQDLHALCIQEFVDFAMCTLSTKECSADAPAAPFQRVATSNPEHFATRLHEQADVSCDDQSAKKPHQKCNDQNSKKHSRKCEDSNADSQKQKFHTLASSFDLLSHEDPLCIFVVRRINKLGFRAPQKLRKFFEQFGEVVRVLSACQNGSRRRPASLGFVQMRLPQSVANVLSNGPALEIDNVSIIVQPFEPSVEVSETEDTVHHQEAAP